MQASGAKEPVFLKEVAVTLEMIVVLRRILKAKDNWCIFISKPTVKVENYKIY